MSVQQRTRVKLGAILATAALGLLAACGSGSKDSSTPAHSGDKITASDVATALAYVGGTKGKADASKKPFTIGFVNGQGGVPSFPEEEKADDAAVAFVNSKLGGVDGHPLKLEKCFIQAEEDGQKCASQLLQANLDIANVGVSVFGNATFYKLIGGKFPVVVSNAVTAADSNSQHVYSFDSGNLGTLAALGAAAQKAGYTSVSILTTNNPSGKYLLSSVVLPDMKKRGIKATTVYLADTSTTPDYVSGLQTAGAAKADAVIIIPSSVAGCVSTYDAMKQVSLTKPVIAVVTCSNDPMPEKTGGGPEGWHITSPIELPLVKSPESNVFNHVMDAEGASKWKSVGLSAKGFGDILTITKFANTIGFDKLSPEAFEKQLTAFRGPAWMIPGSIHCGAHPAPEIGLCGDSTANAVFQNGTWKTLAPFKGVTLKSQ